MLLEGEMTEFCDCVHIQRNYRAEAGRGFEEFLARASHIHVEISKRV